MSIRKGELIGLDVEIIAATDPGIIGLKGKVVDETMKTFTIEKEGKEKMVQKKGVLFRFDIDDGIDIHGEDILYRPEERIKRAR